MTLDRRLLSLLICPICKGPLQLWRDGEGQAKELMCPADQLAFPIRDGIAIMLETEARKVPDAERDAHRAGAAS